MSLDVLQGRPTIENQPSGLRRITRFRKLNGEGAKSANISSYFDAYGTADVEFTTALLVEQRIERRSEGGEDVSLVKVYQELADNALTATTDVTETTTFDGRRVTRTLYLCRAEDAASLRPAISTGTGVFQVEVETVGPVSKVTKFVIAITDSGFVLSTSSDEKNNGMLLTRTIRTVGAAPATPSGYTLVSPSTQQIDGYTVYTYGFAKGLGEAGRDTDYFQSSDEGTTGGTRITITHFTAPATDTDPTSSPGAGYARASVKKSEADGYRVWVVVWAKGTGIVVTDVDTKNGGKLVVYHRVGFGAAPTTPSATLGGTVTATRTSVREADGIQIYDYEWAEGVGEISRDTSTKFSGQMLRTTIRHLTPLATGTQPTSDPHTSGSTLHEEGKSDQDGYRLWTVTWTKALSTAYIVDSTVKRNKGKLVLYRRERFGSAPSAPSATIAGTVVETDSSERLEDGYTVYVKEWAEGVGTVTDSTQYRHNGKLVIYRKVALGTAPSAPSPTIAGTVTLTQDDSRDESGVTIYDRTWTEGVGIISTRTNAREDGSIVYDVVTVSAAASTPSYPGDGTGYLTRLDQVERDGFWENNATYIKPPANFTRPVQVEFRKPGLATAANPPTVIPPVTLDLMGTETVTFSTSKTTDVPYKISAYASLFESYTRSEDGLQFSKVDPLPGYLGSSSTSGTNTTYRNIEVDAFSVSVAGSTPTALPTGEKILAVRCDKYLTATDGTTLWRNAVVTADVT